MQHMISRTALLVLIFNVRLNADVVITERPDRIQVKIEDQIFTEWRHQDWVAPFLSPVVGPNGENVTRHYPMKAGVPGEDPDHPHHRSIRFSHSDINGFNFWWAPGKPLAGHTAEIRLEKIEKASSGKSGELILWNQWLGDGKVVVRERVRLTFIPLTNRQLLMDYDIDLHAVDVPVLIGDKRDGGLMVRVAGWMKVEDEKGNKGNGTIINSRGDRNADAWGKRAEWADYSGPDDHGKTVGIAIFDHPSNVRFPTHWHARTYGLITANRFGTDHFKGNYNDHKTVICRPAGNACPACASHSGDFTLAAGKSITLKHRLYFHHGDAATANVADQYRDYTAEPDAILSRMKSLHQDRKWRELIEQFQDVDFEAWPPGFADKSSEALHLRGQAYSFTKAGDKAAKDLRRAVQLAPRNSACWLTLAENYSNNLNDDEQALIAYRQSLAVTGKGIGWQPLTATVAIARLLTDQVKTDEALAILNEYGNQEGMAPGWRIRILRAYGHVYAARGDEKESLAKFREALELESKQ